MSFSPDTSGHVAGSIIALVFFAIFTAVCSVMTVFFLIGGPMALVPMFMALIGGWLFVRGVAGLMKFNASPLERVLALVRDETVEVSTSTSGTGSSRRTTLRRNHYLLLETRDGQRQSHGCDADLARRVVKGDLGVAYVKGGVLVDFRPLPRAA